MNIIFLDIDGVLNSIKNLIKVYEETNKAHSGYNYPFDKNCLINFKKLVEKTNSKIVITSTWRYEQEGIDRILKELKKNNLDNRVIGYTPILNTKRENEIKDFLSKLNSQSNFIIIDDDSLFGELKEHLIKTNNMDGLTEEIQQKE